MTFVTLNITLYHNHSEIIITIQQYSFNNLTQCANAHNSNHIYWDLIKINCGQLCKGFVKTLHVSVHVIKQLYCKVLRVQPI